MQYMILVYQDEAEVVARTPEQISTVRGAYMAYRQALSDAGMFHSGAPLELSTTGTTIRVRDQKRTVHDGPYADTKEQFGGFFIIDCPDLDTALDWAAKCPAAQTAAVEVRPVMPFNHS